MSSLTHNLAEMERSRESYWLRYLHTSPVKLRWRALAVRHCFHVLPGESILELGAGSGLWTEQLAKVLRGENPITATVFNEDLNAAAAQKNLPGVRFVRVQELEELLAEQFDYVVGTAILSHNLYPQNLRALHRLLKPGGELLFFEANYWNPQVLVKNLLPTLGRWSGQARCQVAMRKFRLLRTASQQGFTHVEVVPYDIVHPRTPRFLVRTLQSVAFILEHAPGLREFCGTHYIWARKPGRPEERRPRVSLARHRELFGAVSFVVPCHNEEMNIAPLVESLVRYYGDYIHEILIVNDNSRDRTAEVTLQVAQREPRVRLLNRQPPNGVGRALRDGYAAARGRYILTMDCDFVYILPEFRDLFEAVADGQDGAIGSRFSYESLLVNYPFAKILGNRGFHLLARLLLRLPLRDISNNLKLYRAEILKEMEIEEPHFAANAETGLKPLLAGYDIKEVPISWINRTTEMGSSTFRTAAVAPNYGSVLARMVYRRWLGSRRDKAAESRARLEKKTPQLAGPEHPSEKGSPDA